jgi:hypothetical protein
MWAGERSKANIFQRPNFLIWFTAGNIEVELILKDTSFLEHNWGNFKMKPMITRWGNPFPKWTKTHSRWARAWLIGEVLFVVIGIIYGVIRAIVVGPVDETFRNYPDIETMFSAAWEEAREDNPEAELLAMQIAGYATPYDEALEYENLFIFCSPSDRTWRLVLQTEERSTLFGRDVQVMRKRVSSEWNDILKNLACSDDNPVDLSCNSECVFKKVLASLSEGELDGLEERPRFIGFGRNISGQLVWGVVFKYSGEDILLNFVFDADTGEVISIEPVGFQEVGPRY